MFNLLKSCKFTKMKGRASASTTDQTPAAALDMTGYDSVCLIAALGDATSGSVLELQVFGVATNAVTGGTELTADSCQHTAASSSDSDDTLLIVDIHRPGYRYIYPTLVIDTQNCESDGIYAIQYNARDLPVSQGSTVLASAFLQKG